MLMDSALLQSETQYAFAAHQPWGEALLLWVCTVELLLPEPLIGIGLVAIFRTLLRLQLRQARQQLPNCQARLLQANM